MTTTKSSPGNPGPGRGRGLDALFEGAAPPVAATYDVNADLAALLDDEVVAAETGGAQAEIPRPAAPAPEVLPPAARTAEPVTAPAGVDVPPSGVKAPPFGVDVPPAGVDVPPAGVDVPPSAAEAFSARPVQPEPPPVSEPAAVPPRLPTTQRFGAIIMEAPAEATPSGPAPAVAAPVEAFATVEALVPAIPAAKAVLPPGPGIEPETPAPLPAAVDRTDDQKAIIISRLDKALDKGWQRELHQQIDGLYKQVATEYSSPPAKAERALSMLREARQLLIDTPEEYVNAEYRTMQVRAMLDRIQESRKQSGRYGPRIFLYQLAWLIVLLAGLLFAAALANWITAIGKVTGPAQMNVYPLVSTMMWGGIGGIVGALYTLWWHISEEQDFDRQYLMWYLVQPLLGMVLGGIVFLLMAGGFLVLNVNLTDPNAAAGARLLPYLTAVLAGFRQNFIYEQLNRLIALFAPAPSASGGNGGGPSA